MLSGLLRFLDRCYQTKETTYSCCLKAKRWEERVLINTKRKPKKQFDDKVIVMMWCTAIFWIMPQLADG